MAMDILDLIKKRRARKAFSNKEIEQDKIDILLEAFRWAPSSRNNQPWKIIVVNERNILNKLFHAFSYGNQLWIANVPLFFVIISKPGLDDIKEQKEYYLFDCGLATENVLLTATSLGLASNPMIGWDEQKVGQVLSIPSDWKVIVLIALGYEGNLQDLPEEARAKDQRLRIRKEFKEFVSYNKFS